MQSFSEREDITPKPILQLDKMNEELSNLVYNFCYTVFTSVQLKISIESVEKKVLDSVCKSISKFSFLYNGSFSQLGFDTFYESLKWNEKYSVVEALINNSEAKIQELNDILERQNSGYRMHENRRLVPITDQVEIDEVEEAQKTSLETVNDHMKKAIQAFSDRENHRYGTAVVEAVHALETLAKYKTREKNGSLGTLVKKMNLPKSLENSIGALYGFSSEEAGRHAAKDKVIDVDFDTAKFVIVTCSAFVNYILSVDVVEAEGGLELPR